MGIGPGQSFNISAFSRDPNSENILDQIETIFAFNNGSGRYEAASNTRIPGAQIEQRRVRELLGNLRAFETFISGLWHFVTPQGTIDWGQYVYFDPQSREVVFFGDETQQVFRWQNSTVTRYGLYISSQNISISTLRRAVDIELESLDSIRIRVFEDLRPQLWGHTSWDGSYRKAAPMGPQDQIVQSPRTPGDAFIEARYDSPFGRIRFFEDGSIDISSEDGMQQGRYTFFNLEETKFLEIRFQNQRDTYSVLGEHPGNLNLSRVRIGARGVERMNDLPVLLTMASE